MTIRINGVDQRPTSRLSPAGALVDLATETTGALGPITGALDHDGTTVGLYGTTPVAQATDPVALTDSTGGTANDTVVDVSTAVTGVDGSGSNAASKADVDSRLGDINDNFADLAAKYNTLRTILRGVGLSA